jgi:hypothetical protein
MLYTRVVPAFEEVEVGKASPGAFKPYLEFYKSLLFILGFTALSN